MRTIFRLNKRETTLAICPDSLTNRASYRKCAVCYVEYNAIEEAPFLLNGFRQNLLDLLRVSFLLWHLVVQTQIIIFSNTPVIVLTQHI